MSKGRVGSGGVVELAYETRRDARIASLTVDRRDRLNVLSSALLEELLDRLDTVAGEEDLRVVTLCGAGDRAFIGGADIYEMAELDEQGAEVFIRRIHEVCRRLRTLAVPVLACIDGYCLGAGLEVALSCDLRLATATSTFGLPEVRVGVPTVIEGALLKHYIGAGRARDLVLSGRIIGADEALSWGLVDRVVPVVAHEQARAGMIEELLLAAPGALRLQKELCRIWEAEPLGRAVEAGVASFVESYRSSEPREYMRRFLERSRDK